MAVAVNLQDVLEYNYFAGIVKMEEKGERDAEKKKNIKNVINKIYNNDMLNAEDLNILAG